MQEAVEKVSSFGKATQVRGVGESEAGEKKDVMEQVEEVETVTASATVPKTGKSDEGLEGR